ncbi:Signal recognition particle protein [Candidatus Hartigia pinicola]|nr:Signal recognition particle protein [Candidatus Hartigia pinicola]
MFDNLTDRLSRTVRNISGLGRMTDDNLKDTLREVRMALLEADVALPVIHEFIQKVKESSVGQNINKSLTPGQTFIKIVQKELSKTMGAKNSQLNLYTQPPAAILITGLQGSGKTTSVAKLGKLLKENHKKKILVVSTDVYRPAAIKQLDTLATIAGIDFFPSNTKEKPEVIVQKALKHAKLQLYDVLLVDTAGRLHIDETMMNEIKGIHRIINPIETLFVIDAMTGQDAFNIAKAFDAALPLTGFVLTKVDGDARGGAALSMRAITGKPIKFLGVGEKTDAIEPFYPDRLSARILGMGDVLSLIEEIEHKVKNNKTNNLTKKLKTGYNFDLNDFLNQLQQMRNVGGMASIIKKIPRVSQVSSTVKPPIDDTITIRMEAIINSMTRQEREKPEIIKGSRKRRIAAGSGTNVQEVNRLLKQFNTMQCMIKKIKKGGFAKMMHNMKGIIPTKFLER